MQIFSRKNVMFDLFISCISFDRGGNIFFVFYLHFIINKVLVTSHVAVTYS